MNYNTYNTIRALPTRKTAASGNVKANWHPKTGTCQLQIPPETARLDIVVSTLSGQHKITLDPWQSASTFEHYNSMFRPSPGLRKTNNDLLQALIWNYTRTRRARKALKKMRVTPFAIFLHPTNAERMMTPTQYPYYFKIWGRDADPTRAILVAPRHHHHFMITKRTHHTSPPVAYPIIRLNSSPFSSLQVRRRRQLRRAAMKLQQASRIDHYPVVRPRVRGPYFTYDKKAYMQYPVPLDSDDLISIGYAPSCPPNSPASPEEPSDKQPEREDPGQTEEKIEELPFTTETRLQKINPIRQGKLTPLRCKPDSPEDEELREIANALVGLGDDLQSRRSHQPRRPDTPLPFSPIHEPDSGYKTEDTWSPLLGRTPPLQDQPDSPDSVISFIDLYSPDSPDSTHTLVIKPESPFEEDDPSLPGTPIVRPGTLELPEDIAVDLSDIPCATECKTPRENSPTPQTDLHDPSLSPTTVLKLLDDATRQLDEAMQEDTPQTDTTPPTNNPYSKMDTASMAIEDCAPRPLVSPDEVMPISPVPAVKAEVSTQTSEAPNIATAKEMDNLPVQGGSSPEEDPPVSPAAALCLSAQAEPQVNGPSASSLKVSTMTFEPCHFCGYMHSIPINERLTTSELWCIACKGFHTKVGLCNPCDPFLPKNACPYPGVTKNVNDPVLFCKQCETTHRLSFCCEFLQIPSECFTEDILEKARTGQNQPDIQVVMTTDEREDTLADKYHINIPEKYPPIPLPAPPQLATAGPANFTRPKPVHGIQIPFSFPRTNPNYKYVSDPLRGIIRPKAQRPKRLSLARCAKYADNEEFRRMLQREIDSHDPLYRFPPSIRRKKTGGCLLPMDTTTEETSTEEPMELIE